MQNLKILNRKIELLKPAEYNPRKIGKKEKTELTRSLKKFGFAEPIVINLNKSRFNTVIGGHQRLAIAKELNMKTVPCVGIMLGKKDEQELNLRLNKNKGAFDDKLLKGFDEKMLREVGFMEKELKKVFASAFDDSKEEEFTSEILEENNYMLFTFSNSVDWLAVSDFFGLKSVHAKHVLKGYKRKGVGRVLNGDKLLKLIK